MRTRIPGIRSISIALMGLAGCGSVGTTTNPTTDVGDTNTTVIWKTASTLIASTADLELAFNNTAVGARDGQDTLHVVFADGKNVSHGLLATDGSNWVVRTLPKLNGASQVSRPTFAIVNDQLMLAAWTELVGAQRSIAVSRSLNGGQLWEVPLLISQGNYGDSLSLCAFTRTSGSGGAVLAWFDVARQRVFVSAWRGTLWAASDWTFPITLSTAIFGVSQNITVAASDDTVVAAWEDNRLNANGDIFIAKSLDGGLTWSTDTRLPVPVSASPQGQNPSLALRTDQRIDLTFQNAGNVYLTSSTSAGAIFSTPRLLGTGRFPHVDVNSKSAIAVAWEFFSGAATDNAIKSLGLSLSLDDGATFTGPHAVPGSASVFNVTQPSVQLSDSDIDAFWIDVSDAKTPVLRHRNGRLP